LRLIEPDAGALRLMPISRRSISRRALAPGWVKTSVPSTQKPDANALRLIKPDAGALRLIKPDAGRSAAGR